MLKTLLQLMVENDRLLSLSDLAKKLGASESLVRQMMDDLVRLGYLRSLRDAARGSGCACDSGQGACHDCSALTSLAGWSVTEKGRRLCQNGKPASALGVGGPTISHFGSGQG